MTTAITVERSSMHRRTLTAVFLATILVAAWTLPVGAGDLIAENQLKSRIDQLIAHRDFRGALWGIVVMDASTGGTLYEHNARTSLVPASVTKIYTTAAVLEQMGPSYRLVTRLYARGLVRDGTLDGDLVIRGAGDPTIAENLPTFGSPGVLDAWASAVSSYGIERITGDVVGDDDVFDDLPYPPGWQWDDLPYYYAAEISGLSYNQNVVDFIVEPREPGMPGRIRWNPRTSYVRVTNETLTIPRGKPLEEGYYREPGQNHFIIRSRVPVGGIDPEALAVYNPTRFFAHRLIEILRETGIDVGGRAVDVDELSEKPNYADPSFFVIAEHASPDLATIASLVNKPSHNLAAETLLKLLGAHGPPVAEAGASGGSTAAGLERAKLILVRSDVDTTAVRLVDGSGLSRLNLVTAEATARVLLYMTNHPDRAVRDAFVSSLSVGGVDGTLRNRFSGEAVHGKVRARTGSLTSVGSLAGYVQTAGNRTFVFAIIGNNYLVPARRVREVQDSIVGFLAALP